MAAEEFKYRSLTRDELDMGSRCVHVLFSRMACNRLATRMFWAPIKPDTAQTYCEAHLMIEKVQFEQEMKEEGHQDWHIVDMDLENAEIDRHRVDNPFANPLHQDVGVQEFEKEDHLEGDEGPTDDTDDITLTPEEEEGVEFPDEDEINEDESSRLPEANQDLPKPEKPARPDNTLPAKPKTLAEVIEERRAAHEAQVGHV